MSLNQIDGLAEELKHLADNGYAMLTVYGMALDCEHSVPGSHISHAFIEEIEKKFTEIKEGLSLLQTELKAVNQ